jgi:hypothetical protein
LNLALLKDSNPDKEFVFVGDENYHEDQKVKYGSGIINIPVEFDITTFKPASTSAAASAGTTSEAAFKHFNTVMDNLRENTCINFFRVTEESHLEKLKNADRQYIKLARALPTERGCDEIIGKKPIKGKADIPTLQPFSEPCLKGNNKTKLPTGIAHYFMHHLGFDNEHQRHDADTFVKHPEDLDLPMINSRPAHNTKFDEGNNASSLTGEYDIKSVMQWSQKWTKSQKGVTPPSHMRAGEVSLFSTKDFAKINNLYGCGSKSLEEKTDCDELITQSTKERAIDYNGRVKKCLEKKSAKANIYFQQPEFRKISSTTISAYKIKATVIYKTIIKKKNRRLAKVWSSNMEIASGDAALYTNRSGGICGGARINIESNENSFICSIQGNESEQSKLIVSKCGEPMKVQYEVIGDYVNENAITSVLKIEGVDYVTCDTDVIGLVGKDSSSGSIFKLFTLVTIFLI